MKCNVSYHHRLLTFIVGLGVTMAWRLHSAPATDSAGCCRGLRSSEGSRASGNGLWLLNDRFNGGNLI